jgi:hypothetical protein
LELGGSRARVKEPTQPADEPSMRGLLALCLLVASVLAPGSASAVAQDPLVDAFSHCKDWYQWQTQPGLEVVACDQAQLDHFIASGLTAPGPGGARIAGPYGRANDVPAVYSTEDPNGLRSVRVTGGGSPTGLYVDAFWPSGERRRATFPATVLPRGVRLHVSWNRERAQLVSPDGRPVATTQVRTSFDEPFAMLPRPRQVHVRRVHGGVAVSWDAAADTVYGLTSGVTRGGAGAHSFTQVQEGQAGRRRVVVRPGSGDHWIGVRAIRGSTFSRMVTLRLP